MHVTFSVAFSDQRPYLVKRIESLFSSKSNNENDNCCFKWLPCRFLPPYLTHENFVELKHDVAHSIREEYTSQ